MAQSLKTKKTAEIFKERLEQLGCPYTEGVDESWIIELIFRPGEQRIRLLQWVFSKLDYAVHDLLDPQYAAVDLKMDSRIQRLLFVASSLGLCRPDDAELIRGTARVEKQMAFIDQLLDIVCIVDAAGDPHMQILCSPNKVSSAMNLETQFASDTMLLESIVSQVQPDSLYLEKPRIFPPDIVRALERARQEKGYTQQDKLVVPGASRLKETAAQLNKNLQHQTEILNQLVEKHDCPVTDEVIERKVARTLKLVLSELSQLLVGFSYGFENEMRAWCNKSAPHLNDLGPALNRVHTMLQQFTSILKSIVVIRGSYNRMTSDIQKGISEISAKNKVARVPGLSVAGVTEAALETFEECIDVLEESVQRLEQSQALNATTHTFNSSVVRLNR